MSISSIIRLILTTILIICVWCNHAWAIKLSLTLNVIALEAASFLIKKLRTKP